MRKLTRHENLLSIYLSTEDQNLSILRDSCKDVVQKQKKFIDEYSDLISTELSKESERKTKFDEKISTLEEALEQVQNFLTEMLDDDIDKSNLAHNKMRDHAEGEMRNVESIKTFCESFMKATESLKEEISSTSAETLDEKLKHTRESANNTIGNFKELFSDFTNCVQKTKLPDESIVELEQRILDDASRRTEMANITSKIQNFKENIMEIDQCCGTLHSEHQAELKTRETNRVTALKEIQDSYNRLNDAFTQGVSGNISSIETSDAYGFSWRKDFIKDEDLDSTLLSAEDNSNQEGSSILDDQFTIIQENASTEKDTGCQFCKNKDDTITTQSLPSPVVASNSSKSTTTKTSKQGKNKKETTHFDQVVEKWCQELGLQLADVPDGKQLWK